MARIREDLPPLHSYGSAAQFVLFFALMSHSNSVSVISKTHRRVVIRALSPLFQMMTKYT